MRVLASATRAWPSQQATFLRAWDCPLPQLDGVLEREDIPLSELDESCDGHVYLQRPRFSVLRRFCGLICSLQSVITEFLTFLKRSSPPARVCVAVEEQTRGAFPVALVPFAVLLAIHLLTCALLYHSSSSILYDKKIRHPESHTCRNFSDTSPMHIESAKTKIVAQLGLGTWVSDAWTLTRKQNLISSHLIQMPLYGSACEIFCKCMANTPMVTPCGE